MNFPELDGAKVGDTIEITLEANWDAGRHLVVVSPLSYGMAEQEAGDAWAINNEGDVRLFRFGWYKIVNKRDVMPHVARESVDVFLREQLNDNLGSIFC